MNFIKILPLACSIAFLASCTNAGKSDKTDYHAIQTSYIDSTVNIQDDFYRFAVGNWMKKNPTPGTEASWGSFNEVTEGNKKILREILETSAKANAAKGTNQQKIGDFYRTGIDSVTLNKLGVEPLKPYLTKVDAITDKKGLISLVADLQSKGIGTVYGLWAGQDDKNSTQVVPQLWQGGLSLPDKDYYLNPKFAEIRDKYKTHIINMFGLIGETPEKAKANAEIILGMETALAKLSMDRITMRRTENVYHKLSWADLNKLTSEIEWTQHAATIGIPKCDSLLVGQPEFFKGLNTLIGKEPLDKWKVFMKWQIIQDLGGYTSDAVGQELFNFQGTALNGIKVRKPRWERVWRTIEENLGEALGELYVAKAFKPEAKERMMKMVKNLQDVFRERIQKLDWMSAETKAKATSKLNKFMVKIGYPDKWRDYSKLEINGTSYLENVLAARGFEYHRNLNKVGKPVDRAEWGMSPQTVNAYYNPSLNEIVFPAGILQPPFFDMNADDAVIYGAIGAVIGHEMTHGFDDQGSGYDEDGNFKKWWTNEDSLKFAAKTKQIEEQFNKYTILDTVHVKGGLTLGENIADLGGLSIGLDALKRTEQAKKNELIDGMTYEQRFFMSWANAWKNNTTNEAMIQQISTDPHSPEEWRANGPVTHFAEFYKAFGIKEGGKMFRPEKERVIIW